MRIELVRITLINFKGIRNLTIDFGRLTEIFGRNATGKTTVDDAFSWLLFDKDSNNKKDFDIKTLDTEGNPMHNLDHEVEGTLEVDGRIVVLRKVYKEKWTKPRGAIKQEFGGHTTDYFVDGVPVKQKEYKDNIDAMVSENVFKLVTNPTYFNVQMSWQERRAELLRICGDVTDTDVIDSNEALAKLPVILGTRSIDDHKKVIAAKRADINKELDKIPVRIDEANRSKPDTEGLNEAELQSEIEQLKFEVESKDAEISWLQSGEEVTKLQNRVREIDGEILDIENHVRSTAMRTTASKEREIYNVQSQIYRLQDDIDRANAELNAWAKTIRQEKERAAALRIEWSQVDTEAFVSSVEDACPSCGQPLPDEKVSAAYDVAVASFKRSKSERLEQIAERGTAAKDMAERLIAQSEKNQTYIQEHESAISQLNAKVSELSAEVESLKSGIQPLTENSEYIAKKRERDEVNNKISTLRQSTADEVSLIRTKLMETRDELRRKESLLARFDQVRKLGERIAELQTQEKTLAAEFERLEEEMYLVEEFTRSKVALLEERINSKFRYARFKLFDTQVNGGLSETCETLYEGVPYGSGLNNAARINVGLDIINTLSGHYGVYAPIFVDNAESVCDLYHADTQMIALYVSAMDKTLRIETDGLKEAV